MAENTKIEWADHTFNPWIGCTQISPGCDNCYAKSWDRRFAVSGNAMRWGAGVPRTRTSASTWAQPIKWNKQAQAAGIRYRVFCASLADVFDNEVVQAWRDDLFAMIASTPNLDWLLLTKRIGNAHAMLRYAVQDVERAGKSPEAYWPWPNVWIGATIVNQTEADRDLNKLLQIPARVHFISYEPALGPINIMPWLKPIDVLRPDPYGRDRSLSWVICGGESGPNARPMHRDWARSLRDQCQAAGVPFLFKQWGEFAPNWFIDDAQGGEIPGSMWIDRMGKKLAGRHLDGRTWNEVPS